MTIQLLAIERIRIDGGTQQRAELNLDAVADYAEAYERGAKMPPLTVYFDGTSVWLTDGFHRFFAAKKLGFRSIECEVVDGTQRDAVYASTKANPKHGLSRNNADKRKAVGTLLADAEWSQMSDSKIANELDVSQPFVSGLRAKLTPNVISENRTYTTKHGTTSTMKVGRIGKAAQERAAAPAEPPAPPPVAAPAPPPDLPPLEDDPSMVPPPAAAPAPASDQQVPAPSPAADTGTESPQTDEPRDLTPEELAMKEYEETLAENARMSAIFDADDRLAAAMAENKRLHTELQFAKVRLNSELEKCAALVRKCMALETKLKRIEKGAGK
jgi:hypothetical protein